MGGGADLTMLEPVFAFLFKNHTTYGACGTSAARASADGAGIWLPHAAAEYRRPVDIVCGSFVSMDQHFRQCISHSRGADTFAAAFHLGSIVVSTAQRRASISVTQMSRRLRTSLHLGASGDAATTVHGSGGISAGSDE
ncbi:hypothetical protein B0H13DRAFT_2351056 [Mycena leptocephala]|nr:hypothetical protein B0H13DRAFT_2351056 [Mycena leptocephala]